MCVNIVVFSLFEDKFCDSYKTTFNVGLSAYVYQAINLLRIDVSNGFLLNQHHCFNLHPTIFISSGVGTFYIQICCLLH